MHVETNMIAPGYAQGILYLGAKVNGAAIHPNIADRPMAFVTEHRAPGRLSTRVWWADSGECVGAFHAVKAAQVLRHEGIFDIVNGYTTGESYI
jgi:hypothetical protein